MPTSFEMIELKNNCYWEWTYNYKGTDVKGYVIYKVKDSADKGKRKYPNSLAIPMAPYSVSDPHIFLPAAGLKGDKDTGFFNVGNYGYYSSSSLSNTNSGDATLMEFNSSILYNYQNSRCYGKSVRAVCQ